MQEGRRMEGNGDGDGDDNLIDDDDVDVESLVVATQEPKLVQLGKKNQERKKRKQKPEAKAKAKQTKKSRSCRFMQLGSRTWCWAERRWGSGTAPKSEGAGSADGAAMQIQRIRSDQISIRGAGQTDRQPARLSTRT